MTTPNAAQGESVPSTTDIGAIARLATLAENARTVFDGGAGKLVILHTGERLERAPDPSTLIETTEAQDVDTFVALTNRFKRPESTLFYNRRSREITTIIDYHAKFAGQAAASPGLKQHRIRLNPQKTPEWEAWHAIHKKPLTQAQFAEFLEERSGEVARPSAAEMLELARSFESVSNSEFASGVRLDNGDTQLTFKANTSATMRNAEGGRVDVPSEFEVSVRPWFGADPLSLHALFRYRVRDGSVRFSVVFIPDPEEALSAAVEDVAKAIAEATEMGLHVAAVPQ